MYNQKKLAANFDSNPPIALKKYDESIRQFCGAYESMFKMAYSFIHSIVKNDADLLIAGAGTGMELCTFAELNPHWKMTGVDPSNEMLTIAKEKLDNQKLTNDISLFKGYVHELPVQTLFNAATCILVMHFFPDEGAKLALLNSISCHLTSGSPFILIDGFGNKESNAFQQTVNAWKHYVMAMGVDEETVEDGFTNQILKRIQFVPEERIKELLEEAGFINVSRFFTSFHYGGWFAEKK